MEKENIHFFLNSTFNWKLAYENKIASFQVSLWENGTVGTELARKIASFRLHVDTVQSPTTEKIV